MSDSIGISDARLEELLRRVMKENNPVQFEELCSELWMVLDERESLKREGRVGGASKSAA